MRQVLVAVLCLAGAGAASAASSAETGIGRTTGKAVESFAGCFAASQGRAGRPWWFVPKEHGGTFSNLGAEGSAQPYFIDVADKGAERAIRVTLAGPDSAVVRSVDQCV